MMHLIARFASADALSAAADEARKAGFAQLETYSPYSLPDIDQTLGAPPCPLRQIMFYAGAAGALVGYAMQQWSAVHAYPINSGGRPLASWPAFLPVTFEFAVLFAAIAGFITFIVGSRLTELNHPVFEVEGFERASSDAFFLSLALDSATHDAESAKELLRRLGADDVREWTP